MTVSWCGLEKKVPAHTTTQKKRSRPLASGMSRRGGAGVRGVVGDAVVGAAVVPRSGIISHYFTIFTTKHCVEEHAHAPVGPRGHACAHVEARGGLRRPLEVTGRTLLATAGPSGVEGPKRQLHSATTGLSACPRACTVDPPRAPRATSLTATGGLGRGQQSTVARFRHFSPAFSRCRARHQHRPLDAVRTPATYIAV